MIRDSTHSTQALAYLGDALFELHVRQRLLPLFPHPQELHRAVVERVRATTQALVMKKLEGGLTDEEREVVRRARNAHKPRLKRLAAPHFRHSTAFEALLGHLHLTGQQERLQELLEMADRILEELCRGGVR